jgi:DNA-binding response OmpR family regulator
MQPMPPRDILVIEDDRKTAELIRQYLAHDGYAVRVAHDGRAGLELARQQPPALVIMDLMLPGLDGLDVCHALRTESVGVPVIMLTARTTEEDKLLGLDTGADDYVTKPFSPRELLARVRAVLRRAAQEDDPPQQAVVGDLVLDYRHHEVRRGSEPVHLTPREFALLRVLAREPGRPFSRFDLLERAFGYDYDGLERTVDVHIGNLRRKIEPDPSQPRYVLTVQGVGYKLVAPRPAT